MLAIEADLSVGRSVWSAPRFPETLISEEPRQRKIKRPFDSPKLTLIRTDGYSAVLIKSGSAADSDQPRTLKKT